MRFPHRATVWLMTWLLTLGWLSPALFAQWQVWTTTQTLRTLREDAPATGLAVHVSAARNEVRGFQILMRSDRAVAGISIQAADLMGPEGSTIPATAAEIYRQHQFELTLPSHRNDKFRPGWHPDALIPDYRAGFAIFVTAKEPAATTTAA
jgi:hypothetical protein